MTYRDDTETVRAENERLRAENAALRSRRTSSGTWLLRAAFVVVTLALMILVRRGGIRAEVTVAIIGIGIAVSSSISERRE